MKPVPAINDAFVLSHRGKKNPVRPDRPYAWNIEKERTASGNLEDTATVFITNSECPFHCLMCDLWKNTTDHPVGPGKVPAQIEWALKKLSPVKRIKLYNSGNFFDQRAIPEEDHHVIAQTLSRMDTVVVETHPRLVDERVLRFRDMLTGRLEIAMGLETVHPGAARLLNKRMTTDDFRKAAGFLRENEVSVRAFILLRPPFLSEEEGVEWAKKSIEFAFDCGVECCVVIPTRAGNGALEHLQEEGHFSPPTIFSLEEVLVWGVSLGRGRVFADLWDIEKFSSCDKCLRARVERLDRMNHTQKVVEEIVCGCREWGPRK